MKWITVNPAMEKEATIRIAKYKIKLPATIAKHYKFVILKHSIEEDNLMCFEFTNEENEFTTDIRRNKAYYINRSDYSHIDFKEGIYKTEIKENKAFFKI